MICFFPKIIFIFVEFTYKTYHHGKYLLDWTKSELFCAKQ